MPFSHLDIKALSEEINLHQNEMSLKRIKWLVDVGLANRFFDVDEETGQSLHMLAFHAQMGDVVRLLFSYAKNEAVLFDRTKKGRTLMSEAVLFEDTSFREIFEQLIEDASNYRKTYLDAYFTQDDDGETPLHTAVARGNAYYVKRLSELLVANKKSAYLNLTNKQGLTAAHFAASHLSLINDELVLEDAAIKLRANLLASLIDAGVDLEISSNENQTVFDIISSYPIKTQVLVFAAITNPSARQQLLALYRKAIALNPTDNIIQFNARISGLVSLQARILAHLELEDPAIRHEYEKLCLIEEEKLRDAEGSSEDVIEKIKKVEIKNTKYWLIKQKASVFDDFSDAYRTSLPSYFKRAKAYKEAQEKDPSANASHAVTVEDQFDILPGKISHQLSPDELNNLRVDDPLYTVKILNHDRATINDLITDIQIYLDDLQRRPATTERYDQAIKLVFLLCYLIAMAVTIYGGIKTHRWSDEADKYLQHGNYNWSKYRDAAKLMVNYLLMTMLVSTFTFVLGPIIQLRVIDDKFKNYPLSTSPDREPSWRAILQSFQNDIINKIFLLQGLQEEQQQNYLMLPEADRANLNNLNQCLQRSQTINDAVSLFTRLKASLETVRGILNRTSKPLTMIFNASAVQDHVAVDIQEPMNENTPLLQYH